MFIFYCDETNLNQQDNLFFIYGGIIIPCENAISLHDSIEDIRNSKGIAPEFQLKFNPKPDSLDHRTFSEVKQSIIESSINHSCNLLATMILHNIATSPDEARRNEINRILYHFNLFLNRSQSSGLVLIDRFHDKQIDLHLKEKFSKGLEGMPYCRNEPMKLEKIVGIHYSAIGQSHFSSLVDIVIGSLRFSVNASSKNDENRLPKARELLRMISPLFCINPHTKEVTETSLFFSPKVITVQTYKDSYQKLKDFFVSEGICPEQEITDTRNY